MTLPLPERLPAMRGKLAADIRWLAQDALDSIAAQIREWCGGDPTRMGYENYSGDATLKGSYYLEERGEWRDYGDETVCVEYYEPELDRIDMTLELFDDGEPVVIYKLWHISQLKQLTEL